MQATTTRKKSEMVFATGEFTMTVSAVKADGGVVSLPSDDSFEVERGDILKFTATGFAAGSIVDVWILSRATNVAKVKVDKNGSIRSDFAVANDEQVGLHHLVVVGVDKAGREVKFELGLNVHDGQRSAWSAGSLTAISIGVAIIVGAAFSVSVRRRRLRSR